MKGSQAPCVHSDSEHLVRVSKKTEVRRADSVPGAVTDTSEFAARPELYTLVTPNTRGDSAAAAIAQQRVRTVDSLLGKKRNSLVYAAGLPDHHLTIVPKPDDAPDSAEEIFAVLRDDQGRIVYAAESPVSQSGDWNIQSSHYFDSTGTTVMVQREASFFNGCTLAKSDSTVGVHETVTSYFAPHDRLVKRTFVRTTFDDDSTPAPTENCNESFRTAYPIYPTWDSLAVATKLGELLRRAPH